jgi:hypothetical protein
MRTETPGAIAYCERCGRKLRVAEKRREDSAPFKLSKTTKGVCPDCVMTQFLYNTYPVNMIIDEAGPEMLLNADFMRMAVTSSGIMQGCEMDIGEVDWQRVVENWKLPVKIQKSPLNPYRMGESPRAGKGRGELPKLGFRSPGFRSPTPGTLVIRKDPKTGELSCNGEPLREPELAGAVENLIGILRPPDEGSVQ